MDNFVLAQQMPYRSEQSCKPVVLHHKPDRGQPCSPSTRAPCAIDAYLRHIGQTVLPERFVLAQEMPGHVEADGAGPVRCLAPTRLVSRAAPQRSADPRSRTSLSSQRDPDFLLNPHLPAYRLYNSLVLALPVCA